MAINAVHQVYANILTITGSYQMRVGVFGWRLGFCGAGLAGGRRTARGAAAPRGHRWSANTGAGNWAFQT